MIFKEETAEELRRKTRDEIIADIRRDTLVLDLMFLEVRRDIEELLEKHKHKSNPNVHLQPRHPRGTSEGGQWMREGNSSTPISNSRTSADNRGITIDNSRRPITNLSRVTVLSSDRKLVDSVNIFVGGAEDSVFRNVMDSDSKNKYIYGDNYYAGFDDEDKINALIENLPKDQKINLIGHSLVGHTVAKIALANHGKINIIVTVDPVTRPGLANPRARPEPLPSSDYFKKIRNSVGMWVHIYADPQRAPSFDDIFNGNLPSSVGGDWMEKPGIIPHYTVRAKVDHADFDAMLDYEITNNKRRLSTIQLLNMDSRF